VAQTPTRVIGRWCDLGCVCVCVPGNMMVWGCVC
jgi:hypothetical protein